MVWERVFVLVLRGPWRSSPRIQNKTSQTAFARPLARDSGRKARKGLSHRVAAVHVFVLGHSASYKRVTPTSAVR